MDKQAQAEAWIRKKPKRIIHNQKLIVSLYMLGMVAAWTLPAVLFYLIQIYPSTVMVCVTVWLVSTITYTLWEIQAWITRR